MHVNLKEKVMPKFEKKKKKKQNKTKSGKWGDKWVYVEFRKFLITLKLLIRQTWNSKKQQKRS